MDYCESDKVQDDDDDYDVFAAAGPSVWELQHRPVSSNKVRHS